MSDTDDLPDALDRRNILYGPDTAPERLRSIGDQYLAAERLLDALEFYVRAEHADGIDAIRRRAVEEGNAFLVARLEQLGTTMAESDWIALAQSAEKRGQLLYAITAYRRGGQAERADELAGIAPSPPPE